MAKGITPITSTTDINAIVRQINSNFQVLSNRTSGGVTSTGTSKVKIPGSVTDTVHFAIYYDSAGLARVAIGTASSTGEEVIAISNDGVNVIEALQKNPMNPADFAFNSSLTTSAITSLQSSNTDLRTRMSTAENNISDNTSNITDLLTRMEAAERELADHEERITALENAQA